MVKTAISEEVLTALEQKRRDKIATEAKEQAALEAKIPKPVGYRLLIALPNVEETFAGSGIVKAGKTLHEEYVLSTVGLVLDMGEQAYTDKDRFPTGAWCKRGDYVMFRANTGTRFKLGGQEYRIMNDDSIEAVVDDPRAITRA
jgi:co-chaperonin GroES (HSP10)